MQGDDTTKKRPMESSSSAAEEQKEDEGDSAEDAEAPPNKKPKAPRPLPFLLSCSSSCALTCCAPAQRSPGRGGEEDETSSTDEWRALLERARRDSAIALPGITDDVIDQCERDYERAFGLDEGTIKIPQPLRELYRTFSGLNVTGDDLWIFGFNVLPLQEVVSDTDGDDRQAPRSVQQYRNDLAVLFDDWLEDMADAERRAKSVCDPRWLVLGVIDEYYNVAVNACPAAEADYGKVRVVVLNDPSESPVADSIEEFWRQLVDVFIEARRVHQQIAKLDPGGQHRVIGFQLCRESAEHDLKAVQDDLARLQDEQTKKQEKGSEAGDQ